MMVAWCHFALGSHLRPCDWAGRSGPGASGHRHHPIQSAHTADLRPQQNPPFSQSRLCARDRKDCAGVLCPARISPASPGHREPGMENHCPGGHGGAPSWGFQGAVPAWKAPQGSDIMGLPAPRAPVSNPCSPWLRPHILCPPCAQAPGSLPRGWSLGLEQVAQRDRVRGFTPGPWEWQVQGPQTWGTLPLGILVLWGPLGFVGGVSSSRP